MSRIDDYDSIIHYDELEKCFKTIDDDYIIDSYKFECKDLIPDPGFSGFYNDLDLVYMDYDDDGGDPLFEDDPEESYDYYDDLLSSIEKNKSIIKGDKLSDTLYNITNYLNKK